MTLRFDSATFGGDWTQEDIDQATDWLKDRCEVYGLALQITPFGPHTEDHPIFDEFETWVTEGMVEA